mmetsp:Transcript_50368/g.139720  ORF Transcript_50368/g.139720 Transcript_50368/m.139720 type:complete len:365 (+) Transcript_50368:602-1696(+)
MASASSLSAWTTPSISSPRNCLASSISPCVALICISASVTMSCSALASDFNRSMVLLPFLISCSRSSVSSLFFSSDFSQRLLWATSSFASSRRSSTILSMVAKILLKCPPVFTSTASLASLKLWTLVATLAIFWYASRRASEPLFLCEPNCTKVLVAFSKTLLFSGSPKISMAFAMPESSSLLRRVRSAHSSAFVLHCSVSSVRKASSASLAAVSSPLSFSSADFCADFSAESSSFSSLLASLNFCSLASPSTFFSDVDFASNSDSSAAFLSAVKDFRRSCRMAMISLDWYLYAAGSPGACADARTASARSLPETSERRTFSATCASCPRPAWLRLSLLLEARSVFMAASTASIASVTFLSATR